MKVNSLKLTPPDLPDDLRVAEPPLRQLYWRGVSIEHVLSQPRVAIVGSRKATLYGKTITYDLATKLSRAGVVVISGLAFGIDSYSHKAVLEAGGTTIAVLPTSIEEVYPISHRGLAEQILKAGGALASEYPPKTGARRENFIARNRIVSALAEVLVITEAARNSGSLHTARFALEQGKTVMAVPGNISSLTSEGCNNLIKSGATPVTDVSDIFFALGIKPGTAQKRTTFQGPPAQQEVFELIAGGVREQDELASASRLSVPEISSALTVLELRGYIRPIGGGGWTVA